MSWVLSKRAQSLIAVRCLIFQQGLIDILSIQARPSYPQAVPAHLRSKSIYGGFAAMTAPVRPIVLVLLLYPRTQPDGARSWKRADRWDRLRWVTLRP